MPAIQVGLHVRQERKQVQRLPAATVCMAEDFPLTVEHHLAPFIDLLGSAYPQFAKFRDFLSSLPPGFPVKGEVPLYHIVTARASLQNHRALTTEDCDDAHFQVPADYAFAEPK